MVIAAKSEREQVFGLTADGKSQRAVADEPGIPRIRVREHLAAGPGSIPEASREGLETVDLDAIDDNPWQPRVIQDQAALEELGASGLSTMQKARTNGGLTVTHTHNKPRLFKVSGAQMGAAAAAAVVTERGPDTFDPCPRCGSRSQHRNEDGIQVCLLCSRPVPSKAGPGLGRAGR